MLTIAAMMLSAVKEWRIRIRRFDVSEGEKVWYNHPSPNSSSTSPGPILATQW